MSVSSTINKDFLLNLAVLERTKHSCVNKSSVLYSFDDNPFSRNPSYVQQHKLITEFKKMLISYDLNVNCK